MPQEGYDVAVVGGGIVGLATARELLLRAPRLRLLLLEKESRVATQQTGHNSGVIHSGVYYAPGSHKARLCVSGRRMLLEYCDQKGIRYELCGKLIVALNDAELPRLQDIYERGIANGAEGLQMMDKDRMRDIEPHTQGIRAVYVGGTGIINFADVAASLAADIHERGGDIQTSRPVMSATERSNDVILRTAQGDVSVRHVIACAGLYSDRLGRSADRSMRIVPFRGDYYILKPYKAYLCRNLIYPVPDPSFPFLGVHFTRKLDGSVLVGPNAVLALARQGYGRWDFNWRDLWETVSFPGFWRLAARFWRTGLAEMLRDYYLPAYVKTMQAYFPEISAADVLPGPSGVRAQAISLDGKMVDDFVFHQTSRMLHVRNAPSPAATSSLAIARTIADQAALSFDGVTT